MSDNTLLLSGCSNAGPLLVRPLSPPLWPPLPPTPAPLPARPRLSPLFRAPPPLPPLPEPPALLRMILLSLPTASSAIWPMASTMFSRRSLRNLPMQHSTASKSGSKLIVMRLNGGLRPNATGRSSTPFALPFDEGCRARSRSSGFFIWVSFSAFQCLDCKRSASDSTLLTSFEPLSAASLSDLPTNKSTISSSSFFSVVSRELQKLSRFSACSFRVCCGIFCANLSKRSGT
mmetsp:Transcript_18870/g.39956  ORF Transcript_18870/g.39956 Transcript_18870/m.39956 type:complete len:232 (+) Transcript_18870:708-1403(+)